jgi:lysophospholipase L1-like esterase
MDLLPAAASLSRFVAMGDSLTAGRGDFGADGTPIGWAQRLAVILSQHTGVPCQLTNLAFDGAKVGAVLSRQLPRLTELAGRGDGAGPDLVSLTVGINDIKAPDFRADQFTADFGRLLAALASTGATVLTCTLPDIAGVVSLPPEYVEVARQRLELASDIIREQSAERGARCLDTWAMREVTRRPDLFTSDRLHPNAAGHRMLAEQFASLLLPPEQTAGNAGRGRPCSD